MTLRASEAAAQCIVVAPVCVFVCLFVCLWLRLTTTSTQCLRRLWALFSFKSASVVIDPEDDGEGDGERTSLTGPVYKSTRQSASRRTGTDGIMLCSPSTFLEAGNRRRRISVKLCSVTHTNIKPAYRSNCAKVLQSCRSVLAAVNDA